MCLLVIEFLSWGLFDRWYLFIYQSESEHVYMLGSTSSQIVRKHFLCFPFHAIYRYGKSFSQEESSIIYQTSYHRGATVKHLSVDFILSCFVLYVCFALTSFLPFPPPIDIRAATTILSRILFLFSYNVSFILYALPST